MLNYSQVLDDNSLFPHKRRHLNKQKTLITSFTLKQI